LLEIPFYHKLDKDCTKQHRHRGSPALPPEGPGSAIIMDDIRRRFYISRVCLKKNKAGDFHHLPGSYSSNGREREPKFPAVYLLQRLTM